MTFSLTDEGTPPPPQPTLMLTDDTHFYLADEFYFVLPAWADGDFVAATDPATHGVNAAGRPYIRVTPRATDLASVPKVLWGLIASYGRQTLPALMHDQLCDAVNAKRQDTSSPSGEAFEDRWRADNLFRHALRDVGMDWMRRWTFWAGVTIGRYTAFNLLIAGLLGAVGLAFSLSLYSGMSGLVYALPVGLGWLPEPTWPTSATAPEIALVSATLVLAPLLLSFLAYRRRLWAFLWVATYLALPVLGLLIVAYVVLFWTRRVPWIVQTVLSWLPGVDFHPGPMPPLTPTGLRPM